MWVQTHHNKITNPFIPVAYLDEKLFYTTNRRRKIARLSRGPLEEVGVNCVVKLKTQSRRFPVKYMLLGVVARPCL